MGTKDNNGLAQTEDTLYLKDEITRCEDIEELRKQIIPMLKSQKEQWKKKINEIIKQKGLSQVKLAEICGVSRVAVNKWCQGAIPNQRDRFMKIGLAAGYGIEEMNNFLQRYGKYPGLYSKSLEDCVCMYVINSGNKENPVEEYNEILAKIKENLVGSESSEQKDIDTLEFDEKLTEVHSEDELKSFINENVAIFGRTYRKLYAYVKMYLEANFSELSSSVSNLADGQGWSSSLKHCVSNIRQNKWYPTRNKIISLGLHLSMDHESIDDMLGLAHMEPLCSKNIFESIIIFVLTDASLNNILDTENEEFDADGLCRYAKEVLSKMDYIDDVNDFISEIWEINDV